MPPDQREIRIVRFYSWYYTGRLKYKDRCVSVQSMTRLDASFKSRCTIIKVSHGKLVNDLSRLITMSIGHLLTAMIFHSISSVIIFCDISAYIFLQQKLPARMHPLISADLQHQIVHNHKLLTIIYPPAKLRKGHGLSLFIETFNPCRIIFDLVDGFANNQNSEEGAQVHVAQVG